MSLITISARAYNFNVAASISEAWISQLFSTPTAEHSVSDCTEKPSSRYALRTNSDLARLREENSIQSQSGQNSPAIGQVLNTFKYLLAVSD